MRSIRCLLAILALTVGFVATTQNTPKKRKFVIIENYFFKSIPVASSQITGMSMVSTPNGTKATGVILANPLPEAAEHKARFAEAKVLKLKTAIDETVEIGSKFPEFKAVDIDGKEWSTADVAGKPMVLNLWFTGCGPCRSEMPELSQWKNEMPDIMFFSATYEDADRARPVIERQGFNWIPLVNDTQFKEWIGAQGYPMTIVVDKAGTIVHVEYGTSPVQREELKKIIESVR